MLAPCVYKRSFRNSGTLEDSWVFYGEKSVNLRRQAKNRKLLPEKKKAGESDGR